jgi:hypothetical protein
MSEVEETGEMKDNAKTCRSDNPVRNSPTSLIALFIN